MMSLLLLSLLVAPSTSQLMYYYLYPSYPAAYSTPTLQYQQTPTYSTQQYICGTPNNYQYQATPCTTANYNPSCETECQSTPYCQRFDQNAQCVNGCCNSTISNSNSNNNNYYNSNQNTNVVARDNSVNDITCPFNDPSAGSCIDGNCPSGFVCNLDNVCCPCSVGAAQGACSAGSCSSSALQCESASGMCCPRPLNATASGYPQQQQQQLQYTQGLQQQQPFQQPLGSQQQFQQNQQQQQSQFQQQFPQQSSQLGQPQQPFGRPSQQNFDAQNQQNQFQQQQQQPQQQFSNNQFNDQQNQNQFQQQPQQQFSNQDNQFQNNQQLAGQQYQSAYNTQSPNQFQQPQNSQDPTTPFVYNTQNPNPSPSPQGSTTTIPTIYPSSG